MRQFAIVFLFASAASPAHAQTHKANVPYVKDGHERHVLDIYAPSNAKNLPVVFWIHGGGWQAGDKSDVGSKPKAFLEKGFVFVSTNYRLLPKVDMDTLVTDVAKSLAWVHKHISEYGGDPTRIIVGGHSAGAQLAALLCTDDRLLKAEGVPFSSLRACIPVDGDTYDIPAIIETAETRRRVHGQAQLKFGHREKFGNTPEKHREFSAVTHVAKGKGIPPFLILFVAAQPDNAAQAQRLMTTLKGADVPVKAIGVGDTSHNKINEQIGMPGSLESQIVFEFVSDALKK
jgi:acetyl esterase/lipase